MRLRILLVAFALLISSVEAWSSAAQAAVPPAAGRFVVATSTQQGFFAKSVILLIAYGAEGAVGVVINHPTKFSLASVLPDPKVLHGRPDLLYVGGPVALDSLTMLIRTPRALPSSVRVLDGVYASESVTTLRAAVDAKLATSKFRAYAGYAGWAPGQLDAELEQGAWTVVPANAAEVFTTAPDDLWEKLSQSGSTMLVRLDGCRRTIHPSCAAQVVRAVAALD